MAALARVVRDQGRTDEAAAVARQARNLDPTIADPLG
jgi:Flp pilus assembly protein TadD